MNKQEEELKEAQGFIHFSQIADSLLTHPEKINHGASAAIVENIHTQALENVTLNPACSTFENADIYYRKSRKGKRGVPIIEEKLSETREEEAVLVGLGRELERVRAERGREPDELERKTAAAGEKLEDLGILPKTRPEKSRKEVDDVPFRHVTLDGWHIYVGKNDAQNDELSTRFARPWDVWMHVAACAGSHVLIRREKNGPWPEKPLLLKAAAFAVWFSKAKHTSYSDVNVTEARYVHKRRHAPPGEVVVERCKTLRVSPMSPQEYFGGDFDK